MKIVIIFLMFFILGALLVISNHAISFQAENDLSLFKDSYFVWLEKVFGNFGKLTGDFVKLDWGQ